MGMQTLKQQTALGGKMAGKKQDNQNAQSGIDALHEQMFGAPPGPDAFAQPGGAASTMPSMDIVPSPEEGPPEEGGVPGAVLPSSRRRAGRIPTAPEEGGVPGAVLPPYPGYYKPKPRGNIY